MEPLGQSRAFSTTQATRATVLLALLSHPASLPKAEQVHQSASSITQRHGVNLQSLTLQKCDCCGHPVPDQITLKQFKLNAKCEELAELGLGFPMFFLGVKCLIGMLLIVLCIASIPNLVQNMYADRQEEFGEKSAIAATSIGGNGKNSSELPLWPVILNLFALFFVCIFYCFMQFYLRKTVIKLRKDITTPSNYAVQFTNLGSEWSQSEFRQHITTQMSLPGTKIDIEDISVSYGTKEYIHKLHEIEELNIRFAKTNAVATGGVPQETPCGCVCLRGKKYITRQEWQEMVDIRREELIKLAKFVKKTGIAIVTLKTQEQTYRFLKKWKSRGIRRLFPCFPSSTKSFKGQIISVKRAPEPEDIIWENLIYTKLSRTLRTCVTTLLLLATLCCSFAILYGLAQWQNYLSNTEDNSRNFSVKIEFSSIPPAIIITIFNIFLDKVVRLMSNFERKHTYTNATLSISWKLTIVMSLNTLLFPLLTHWDAEKWYTPGGLANNIFWVAISAAFVKPLFRFFYPSIIWKYYRRWEVKRVIQRQSAYISQGKANQIYQYPDVYVEDWYADVMIKVLLCLAYAPLLPLIVPIILLGLVLEYCVDKWILLRRSSRPRLLNEQIALVMYAFVQPAIVLYGVSILVFSAHINPATRPIGIVSLLVSVVFFLLFPVISSIFHRFFSEKSLLTQLDYKQVLATFPSVKPTQNTYRADNPFTHFDHSVSPNTENSQELVQEGWSRHYVTMKYGLLTVNYTPVYERYERKAEEAEGSFVYNRL